MKKKIQICLEILLGLPKSIYVNFKYLSIKQAVKLPILVSWYCNLLECSGQIKIEAEKIKTGMILIGIGSLGIFDKKSSRSVLELGNNSHCVFKGNARFGNGVKISSNGDITFGEKFIITGASTIYCCNRITFGDGILISWDTLIMDSDVHKLYKNNRRINEDEAIRIGNHVWIGCRCTLLKGIEIADGSVIGAGSLINKSIEKGNVIIAGNPGKIISEGIDWKH